MDPAARIRDLEASHDLLRGALLAAGRELRRVAKSKRREILLARMREVLRGAREVRKA